jgi:hypothetical protein
MKEQFREWNMKSSLNVQYTDGTGNKQRWSADQHILISQISGIIGLYQHQKITLTNRQLYYQLVAGGIIPNADEIYRRICKFLTDARYAGLIDWDAIEDRGREPQRASQWDSIKSLVESAVYSYRLPRWSDQDRYVELYCEKQAMESVFRPIANKYHVYFGCNKGYSSASTMYELAKRVKQQIEDNKEAIILYFGDHDSSGLDMVRDIRERIEEFLTKGTDYVDPNFQVKQLALNMEQIKQYNPPPNPAKITDPRAAWYISEYGKTSWELDALKPEILIQLAEQGILKYIDIDKYNAWIEKEQTQRKALEEFADKLTGDE